MKRFEVLKPPKGKQTWEPTTEDRREGIVRSNLMKHFGFNSTTDLESRPLAKVFCGIVMYLAIFDKRERY